MASDGLSNRQIGDRLFLSPRTVSSHLYRSYPKLGVAGGSWRSSKSAGWARRARTW
jgi:DNA-binding NarL/FixJ family response regulator